MVVICQICGFETESHLQSHLVHKHKTKPSEYQERFPGYSWCSEEFAKKMKKIRGENARTEKALSAKSAVGSNNLGRKRSKEFKEIRSKKYSGKGNPFYGKRHSLETKKKLSCHFRGISEDEFEDFSKPLSRREVGSGSFKIWRRKVFERDNFTCLLCNKRGGPLEPHHIIPRRDNKELIYEVSNGATLCIRCHRTTFGREFEFSEALIVKVRGG